MQKTQDWKSWITVILAAFLVVGMFSGWGNTSVPEQTFPTIQEIALATSALIVVPAVEIPETDNEKIDEIHQEIFLSDNKEEIAEDLVLELIEDRDFKKDLVDFLNDQNASVESYKDIEKVTVKDIDTSVAGTDAEVELELKVYFYNDGDDDEEDVEKAKLFAYFDVEDLDEDEEYEDAEAEFDYFDFTKFYE